MRRGTTPQTEGLEFEEALATRLRSKFPGDKVEHHGRSGDVLQTVRMGVQPAGRIIYECKRTQNIPGSHVQQALRAKQERQADFAILVTTGTRRSFTGLAEHGGVLIVHPLGVIALATLLREQLVQMTKAKMPKTKRSKAILNLFRFVEGPQFRNPLDQIIAAATDLRGMLHKEAQDHMRTWKRRWSQYEAIRVDSSWVEDSVRRLLLGKSPGARKALPCIPLTLPIPAGASSSARGADA